MPLNAHWLLLLALLCLPLRSMAATVHRCDGADGRITFTTLSCATGERFSMQEVRPFTPGSLVQMMPEAEPRGLSNKKIRNREPTVVGGAEDKCGNLISAGERRQAIISRRIVAGMSRQDVESALGRPDKVTTRNASMSYRYNNKRGRSAHVEFDEKGCTQGKSKSRTAKSPL